jgi:hypothetical protein
LNTTVEITANAADMLPVMLRVTEPPQKEKLLQHLQEKLGAMPLMTSENGVKQIAQCLKETPNVELQSDLVFSYLKLLRKDERPGVLHRLSRLTGRNLMQLLAKSGDAKILGLQ